MHYDFSKLTNRRGSGSYKWDIEPDSNVLPMWVADMDFEAAPCIREALADRVAHGIFGYTLVPDSYYEAVTSWFSSRHGWVIDRQWLLYTSGVVPAMSCAIRALTLPGDKVLVLTPVYNCFFSSIRNQGCEVVESRLVRHGNTYTVDFDDFEAKCADSKTTVFLLCNPHNPGGRVWTKDELSRFDEVCRRHGVTVVADEIHCELVMPGSHAYTPFASIGGAALTNSVTLNSPSKAFNTAGLQIANIVCADAELRRRIDRVINIHEVCDVNPFGPVALEAAYRHGAEWLDELNLYIQDNYNTLCQFVAEHLPGIIVMEQEGTYLTWLDITALGMTSDEVTDTLLKRGKLLVNSGTMYGHEAGEGYIRLNLACPRTRLLDGLHRMATALLPPQP